MVQGNGLPARWERAVRWYRRALRERQRRETEGVVVVAELKLLCSVLTVEALKKRYCERTKGWADELLAPPNPSRQSGRRCAEDIAFGPRWLEIMLK